MIYQSPRVLDRRRARDQRIRNLPLWAETTRTARLSDWLAGLFVVAAFVVMVAL